MRLPDNIWNCLEALENAGFSAYAVGGCVRDMVLGREPHDYDLCTSALPEQIQEVFSDRKLVLTGVKHGTVVVETEGEGVEITTFRTEGAYTDNRHPDWVRFVTDVREDLARRDFTVNAMAWSPLRGFADPFGGREDLEKGILRTVGDPWTRFREDALRILRAVRFASRYGLAVDPETEKSMLSLAPLLDNLARERVFAELCTLLPSLRAEDLRRFRPIFCAVIPELGPTVDFDQHSPHHAYDLYTHICKVVENTPPDLTLRWAALLHDTGKIPTFTRDETGRGHFYGHAQASGEIADGVLRRLKAPTALREQVVLLIEKHMICLEPDRKALRRWVSHLGFDTVEALVGLQRADMASKGTGENNDGYFAGIQALLQQLRQEESCFQLRDLVVNGYDLSKLGITGPDIGKCLQELLELVLEEQLPNEREALLSFVKQTDKL